MQDTQPTRSPLVTRLLIAGGAVLVLIAVIVVTILLLKNVVPTKETATDGITVKANELVAMYSVPGVIKGLSSSLYDLQITDDTKVPVIYKSSDHPYATSILTSYNALFSGRDKSAQNDTEAIQAQTDVFMKLKGYTKIANSIDGTSSGSQYATFMSKTGAVCQLISSGVTSTEAGIESVPVSHQIACAEKTAINDEYSQIENLLKLYKGTQLPKFTSATRTIVTEGDKSFTTLTLKNKPKSPILLFASVHDQWSFVADLNGTGAESNGKYVITPDIKTKLDDPKYGGFLVKYIIGTTS